MNDAINYGTRTAGQSTAASEMRRVQYLADARGNGPINIGPVPSDDGLKRKPDPTICEICGETVPGIAAFHFDVNGDICVRDPKRTLMAGKISRARYEEIVKERSVKSQT